MQQPSIFEPVQALVVPSGYVHSQPQVVERQASSNAMYGAYSNQRGLNQQAMNMAPIQTGEAPRTRASRVSENQPFYLT